MLQQTDQKGSLRPHFSPRFIETEVTAYCPGHATKVNGITTER